MKKSFTLAVVAVIAFAGSVEAQESPPVPGYAAAKDVPGAHVLPDPDVEHKVVFDAVIAAENIDDVNPMLVAVARYVNTLAKYGVPPENRKIAVVFHQAAGPIVMKNEVFKARNDGHDNPNVELIRNLHAAGVKLHVCGQGALARNIAPEDILPEIQLDLWALTTLIDFGQHGYVRIGG
ncbi:MAG: DsrE family protein [Proteobacteria bacterium]|nr:DsrE family protein [Pseudomonadota bacterium]